MRVGVPASYAILRLLKAHALHEPDKGGLTGGVLLKDTGVLQNMAEHGADLGLWDVDLNTGVRSLNRRSLEMAGNKPEDPPENMAAWVARIHPDDREQAGKSRNAHQRGETEALIMEYRIRHRDGHWVWLHSRGKVTHRGADGTPLRIIGTYQDISERKAAESQIAEFAYHYSLTGLPNRRALTAEVQALLFTPAGQTPELPC